MNNKKVGIVTVHRNVNYGANLQAFASARFLNNNNINSEIIDYLPEELDRNNYLFSWLKLSWENDKSRSLIHKIKLFISLLLSAPQKYKKLKAFNDFRKQHCHKSRKYSNLDELGDAGYTDVVCGSDQIWNPDITNGIKPVYFGDILGVKNKISYAASMGRDQYNKEDEQAVARLIQDIDYVSLREAKSVRYIEEISGKKVFCVCDPVFLLEMQDYLKIAKPLKIRKPYLLVYSVVGNKTMLDAAIDFARQKDLNVVEICQNKNRGYQHIQLTAASPEEFLGAINNAEYIVTNSFHGTAFSIIFNKEFYVFDNKERGSRITELVDRAGLNNRIVENEITEQKSINYKAVAEKLKQQIDFSKAFLLSAVGTEKRVVTENCVGCGACKEICKTDAIALIKNEQGFIKSYIDTSKCTNCGRCKKVCPIINTPPKTAQTGVFAYKAKDSLRKNSTSGGAAAAFAEEIINMGGVVFGAHLNENFELKHIAISSKKNITLMQGTKYIQSNITDCFKEIEQLLREEITVLFIGTPCQTAAVSNFVLLRKLNSKYLYLCDIICHGVPSVRAFHDFVFWLKKRQSFDRFYFRNKSLSWRGDSASVDDNNKMITNRYVSSFMNLYYSNLITDTACFNCKFTTTGRVSDITISDFWGIENTLPEFEDDLGVSMVLVNTQKGEELFSKIAGKKKEANIAAAKQPQLNVPTKKPSQYDEFWKNYNIDIALNRYGAIKESLKTKIYKLIKGSC